MKIRMAVVGAGWAGKHHAEAIRRHPQAEVAAIVDENPARAAELSELMGQVPTFRTVPELLRSGLPFDGGSVCTLPATHVPISKLLVESGKHVLCEKPMGREPEAMAELHALSLQRQVKVGVSCNQRFAPTLQRLKRHIESGERVHMVQASMHQNGPKTQSPHDSDYRLISDACIHMIDSLRYLNGEIDRVHAYGVRIDSEIVSDVTVNLHFANGSIGTMAHTYVGSELSPGRHPFQLVQLSTDRARYTVDNLVDRLTIYPHRESEHISWCPSVFAPKGYETTLWASVAAWLDCLLDDQIAVPVDLMDAIRSTRVVKACIASVRSGQPVAVDAD